MRVKGGNMRVHGGSESNIVVPRTGRYPCACEGGCLTQVKTGEGVRRCEGCMLAASLQCCS